MRFQSPPHLKIRNGQEKYILRKAVDGIVPPIIINRKKQGFGTPIGAWFTDDLKEVVCQKLDEGQLVKKLFRQEKMQRLLENFRRNPRHRAQTIWTILALQVWHEVYFET